MTGLIAMTQKKLSRCGAIKGRNLTKKLTGRTFLNGSTRTLSCGCDTSPKHLSGAYFRANG